MQPRTKRKKAETRVKSSTCCERTAAPILKKLALCTKPRKENNSQSLENTKSTKSKARTKHREKAVKERGWPANFGKEKNDNLEDNKQAVDDSPKNAANLVGYGAVPIYDVSTQ